jgi:membrane protease YdiL (CAAX protease family)
MVTTPEIGTPQPSHVGDRLWTGKDVALMSLATIAAFFIAVFAIGGAYALLTGQPDMREMPAAFTVGIIAIQGIVMLAAVWLAGLKRRGYTWADIGLRPTTPGWIAAAVGLFFVLRLGVTLIAVFLAQLGVTSMQAQAFAPAGVTWVSAIAMLFFAGLLVPFAEEIFFRGVVYRWMRDKWGVPVGVIVSGLVFGIAHFEPATVIPAIVLGMALALVFEKSKSLWPCIVIHALNNTLAIGLLYVLMASGVPIPGTN